MTGRPEPTEMHREEITCLGVCPAGDIRGAPLSVSKQGISGK